MLMQRIRLPLQLAPKMPRFGFVSGVFLHQEGGSGESEQEAEALFMHVNN